MKPQTEQFIMLSMHSHGRSKHSRSCQLQKLRYYSLLEGR